jgi:hypothetical protein
LPERMFLRGLLGRSDQGHCNAWAERALRAAVTQRSSKGQR